MACGSRAGEAVEQEAAPLDVSVVEAVLDDLQHGGVGHEVPVGHQLLDPPAEGRAGADFLAQDRAGREVVHTEVRHQPRSLRSFPAP